MILNRGSDKTIAQFDKHPTSVFKKYLPISDLDYKWGFTVNDVGHTKIGVDSEYPTSGHPGTHMFSWEEGRILEEYHFILITEGEGIFENKTSGTKNIKSGDGILLFPGEWHRYKPARETGWTESWIGFSGKIPDIIMQEIFFPSGQNIISNCANQLVQDLIKTLFQLVSEEPYGFQRTASGICMQLIAEICNIQNGSEASIQASTVITKAKHLMHKKIEEEIDFHMFCKNHRISYSKFRTDFKRQTGFAPLQYFILMKIAKAKDLLISSNLHSKQIAYNLGFKSDHYFCRLFKQKTGLSPSQFRTKHRIQIV